MLASPDPQSPANDAIAAENEGGRASGSRRTSVEDPIAARADALRDAQVGAVGASFLRLRPWIVGPVALVNGALLASSGAPASQRVALGVALGTALTLFVTEAWVFRRRDVGARWLAASLAITLAGIALGCWISGGIGSPLVPLLAAPTVVSFAAFGRRRATGAMLGLAAALALVLTFVPGPFPAVPSRAAFGIALASFGATVALAYAGVAGLVEAHARAARILDAMRIEALEETASRVRQTEQLGAKVAHELKNPLAAVRAIVQLLEQGEASDKDKKRLAVARGEIDRMDTIVREYLAFSRPLVDLRLERIDALEVLRDAAEILDARARQSGVDVRVAGERAFVEGDPRRLREAILNLALNAIEASPRGATVTLQACPRDGGARVEIADAGPGVPESVLDAQGAAFVTTKERGTGLGLAIAKGIIARHGGEVAFRRAHGGGTLVVVDLPATPPASERSEAP